MKNFRHWKFYQCFDFVICGRKIESCSDYKNLAHEDKITRTSQKFIRAMVKIKDNHGSDFARADRIGSVGSDELS